MADPTLANENSPPKTLLTKVSEKSPAPSPSSSSSTNHSSATSIASSRLKPSSKTSRTGSASTKSQFRASICSTEEPAPSSSLAPPPTLPATAPPPVAVATPTPQVAATTPTTASFPQPLTSSRPSVTRGVVDLVLSPPPTTTTTPELSLSLQGTIPPPPEQPSTALVPSLPPTATTPPSIAADADLPPLLWAARIKSSLRNLKKCAEPDYLDDGTPVVLAPDSVILEFSQLWKNFIIAHFLSAPPPGAKIFADLNPIWGRQGNISVRQFSPESCLIFIPSESTREWVLDVGYWQANNCAFTVSKWSPSPDLQPPKLTSIPLWVILRKIPPQLYSLSGISIIASAIGESMHTEKSRLNLAQVGEAKIKVEIRLNKPLPSNIVVKDSRGNSVQIEVDYPRVPPSCNKCKEFGHPSSNCPLNKKKKLADTQKPPDPQALVGTSAPAIPALHPTALPPCPPVIPKPVPVLKVDLPPLPAPAKIVQSASAPLPIITSPSTHTSLSDQEPASESSVSANSDQDDLAKVLPWSNKALNLHPSASSSASFKNLSPKAKRRARKKLRQALKSADEGSVQLQPRKTSSSISKAARGDPPPVKVQSPYSNSLLLLISFFDDAVF